VRIQETPEELELAAEIESCAKDPLKYAVTAFPWGEGELEKFAGPLDWQAWLFNSIRDGLLTLDEAIQIAVASGHDIGKSATVAMLILWAISTREDTRGVVTANTDVQLRTKTWAELSKWYQLCINKHWFTYTANSLYSVDPAHERTWRIDAVPWSTAKPESFQGLHNLGKRAILIFDEASAIEDRIWETGDGVTLDADTEIIWCAFGNPTRNTGRFFDCFHRFAHRWKTRQIDSREVPIANKKKIQQWIDDYGIDSDFVKVRARGLFPSASARQFISVEDADAGYGRELRPSQYNWAPKIICVDPAWTGEDEFCIGCRQGLAYRELRNIPYNDNDVAMANLIAQIEDDEQADAVIVDGGMGTGIVSVGRTLGRDWLLVWFNDKSANPGCLNKRAEIWQAAKTWLKEGGAYPPDPRLHDELIGPETVPRLDGKIQIESKDDMRDRGLASPNRADCLAISFAYPVQKKDRVLIPGQRRGSFARHTYNVLEGRG
jgi:hypothetical protein